MYNVNYGSSSCHVPSWLPVDFAPQRPGSQLMYTNMAPHPFSASNGDTFLAREPSRSNSKPAMFGAPPMQGSQKGRVSYALPVRVIGEVNLRDIDRSPFLGASGGMRLYLLGKQIKHTFTPIDKESWEMEKESFKTTHNLPYAEVPILTHNGSMLCGSTASLRYLTKKMGEYGSDVRRDFIADAVCDKLAIWRKVIDEVINAGKSERTSVLAYDRERYHYYEEFERALNRHIELGDNPQTSFFAGVTPMMCDYMIMAILWDDKQIAESFNLGGAAETNVEALLERFPCLKTLYGKLMSHPQIHGNLEPESKNRSPGGSVDVETSQEQKAPTECQNPAHQRGDGHYMARPPADQVAKPGYSSASYEPPMQALHMPRGAQLMPHMDNAGYSYTPPTGAQMRTGFYPQNVNPAMLVGQDRTRAGFDPHQMMHSRNGSRGWHPALHINAQTPWQTQSRHPPSGYPANQRSVNATLPELSHSGLPSTPPDTHVSGSRAGAPHPTAPQLARHDALNGLGPQPTDERTLSREYEHQ